jgi:hypothetical protein
LWVPPSKPPIPERYHDAVEALADWAGPDWGDNDRTYFFPIRGYLIECYERWLQYDWEADRAAVREWRRGRRFQASLVQAATRFHAELERSSYMDAYRKLGLSIGAELAPDAKNSMSYDEGIAAARRGMDYFVRWIGRPERFLCRFGCVEFEAPPARLPKMEVAIALSLADFVTGFRRDGRQAGALWFPRPPELSKNLPWKAISLIVSNSRDDSENDISPEGTQARVEKLASRVTRIHRYPN